LTTKYRHDAHPTSAWSFFVIERSKGPAVALPAVALRAVVLRLRLRDNDRLTLPALFTPQETTIAVMFFGALSGLSVTTPSARVDEDSPAGALTSTK
jgi:hypothetical protein